MGKSVNIMESKYLSDIINTVGDLKILSVTSELSYGDGTKWTLELSSDTKHNQNEIEKSLPMTNKEIDMKLNFDSTGMSNALQASWLLNQGIWLNNPAVNEYCCCDTRTNSSKSLTSDLTIQQAINDLNTTNNKINNKENKTMINNNNNGMMNAFNGMFGKLENGTCRLSMHGGIAVKTSNGYKTYNVKTGRLVNCSNFVFPVGDEMFFVIPTNKVENGDIILVAGKPRCVIEKDKNTITVINYEDSTIEKILPERYIFMGNAYFYGKIVSMFGDDLTGDKKGMSKIMKYMMLSEMMGGNGFGSGNNMMSNLMPLMMLGGNMGDLFGDIFNFEDDDSEDDTEPEEIPTTPLISE